MTAKNVILECHKKGIYFSQEKGMLKTQSEKGAITPELAKKIRKYKQEIIALLKNNASSAMSVVPVTDNKNNRWPLSYSQQRLWFTSQLEDRGDHYNMFMGLTLTGSLNIAALNRSLNTLIERHEVLRTNIFGDEHGDYQRVRNFNPITLQAQTLHARKNESQEECLLRYCEAQKRAVFDISKDVLIRATLFELSARSHALLLTVHHIACDGWSLGVLVREIFMLYCAYEKDKKPELNSLPCQYKDYAYWQRAWLKNNQQSEQLSYWKKQLAALPKVHSLALDKTRPLKPTHNGSAYYGFINNELCESVQALAKQHKVTPFMFLYTVFVTLLSRYSNETDIVIGTPVANREQIEISDLIGFFVNNLVLRSVLNVDETFASLLSKNRQTILDAYAHQQIPFDLIVEALKPQRSISIQPLFQLMFSYQVQPTESESITDIEVSSIEIPHRVSLYDLSLYIVKTREGLTITWEYNTDLFLTNTIARMSKHFIQLLEQVVATTHTRLSELSLLNKEEKEHLLYSFQGRELHYCTTDCIHNLFEKQVRNNPHRIALIDENNKSLSYLELNHQANQLARYLQDQNVETGSLVGVCLQRTERLLISLLAILKAGAAYVPLDPAYPQTRLTNIVNSANLQCLLVEHAQEQKVANVNADVIVLDQHGTVETLVKYNDGDVPIDKQNITGEYPAYVIFTSGSTGQPKGVEICHRNTLALIAWAQREFSAEELAVVAAVTSINFDLSVFEIFVPLCSGSTVLLLSDALVLRKQMSVAPTLLNMVPSAAKSLVEQDQIPVKTQVVNLAGEPLPQVLLNDLLSIKNINRVLNLYGPSEDTTYSTYASFSEPQATGVPIGAPVDNTQVYVLSPQYQLLPVAMIGELYLGGQGVARGYRDQAALTAQRFIPNPFVEDGSRLYCTGDLVRWSEAGVLEYIGRVDEQVKLRGFRIEPAEVEHHLLRTEEVKEAVVVVSATSNENKCLVAYVVTEAFVDEQALQQYLSESLPAYMVPSFVIVLDQLPLMPNGKIDRVLLSSRKLAIEDTSYCEPVSVTEKALAQIWCETLSIDKAGREANFFELGGQSILATRLLMRIQKNINVDISLQDIFLKPKLRELAEFIDKQYLRVDSHNTTVASGCRIGKTNEQKVPLSYAQQRLWFIDRFSETSYHYNVPLAVRLSGSLDTETLEYSFAELIKRHTVLTTKIVEQEGVAFQQIEQQAKMPIEYKDYSEIMPHHNLSNPAVKAFIQGKINEQAKCIFALDDAIKIRATIIKLSDAEHLLLITLHHIVVDGWSLGILIDELGQLYNAFRQDTIASLASLDIQYKDYAYYERTQFSDDAIEKHLSYWKQQLKNIPSVHNLPLDKKRPSNVTTNGGLHQGCVDTPILEELNVLARSKQATLFMVVHSAFALFLGRYSREQDIVIGTPVANRENESVAGLIGLFVNSVVLRSDLSQNISFSELISQSRDTVISAFSHQQLPFELLVDALQPNRNTAHHPLFQVVLSFQNNSIGNLAFDGLTAQIVHDEHITSKFDLTLGVHESADGLILSWEYNTDLFSSVTIERMHQCFSVLLQAVAYNPEQNIQQLPLQKHTDTIYSIRSDIYPDIQPYDDFLSRDHQSKGVDVCLHELFEQAVERHRSNIAVKYQDSSWTYEELNVKANRLANYLIQEKGTKPDRLIGILMFRSIDMIVSILAVLKAGGAYVPLDPKNPSERVKYIINDADLDSVLTHSNCLTSGDTSGINADDPRLVLIDSPALEQRLQACSSSNIESMSINLNADNLAYIIYTSGSTGKPKGVMTTHNNAVRLFSATHPLFSFSSADTWTFLHSFAFDFSVWEIWGALLHGGKLLVVTQQANYSPFELFDLLVDNNVTILSQTPGAFVQLVETVKELSPTIADKLVLKSVVLGGDALNYLALKPWFKLYGDTVILVNMYGITETTVHVTYKKIKKSDVEFPVGNSIGLPLCDLEIYLLDDYLNPVPPGAIGEMYVKGPGIARGYLNRPQLSEERFIDNPFSSDQDLSKGNTRLYKTGDIARVLPSGELDYLGRNDFQVKLRGFRIELGEIQSELSELDSIKQAVVIDRERNGRKYLAAYVVLEVGELLSVQYLRDELAKKLPDYMIPETFTELDNIPLTINAKLDRSALPEPVFTSQDVYLAPSTSLEKHLCNIWKEVLGVAEVGLNDNFFRIGGDSIISIQLVSRMRKDGLNIRVKDIFEAPTIKQLANRIENPPTAEKINAEQGILTGSFHLLPIQQWFFNKCLLNPHHWNQAFSVVVPSTLTVENIESALSKLADQHDMLRCLFEITDSGYKQRYLENVDTVMASLQSIDISNHNTASLHQKLTSLQNQFDLVEGPLWQVAYIKGFDDNSARLFFAFHHLIIDAVSWRIIVDDLKQLLHGQHLPEKTSSYRQWVASIKRYALNHQNQIDYWNIILQEQQNYPSPQSLHYMQECLSPKQTNYLLHQANKAYYTEINDLLLSALSMALNVTFKRRVNNITLEGHGREDIDSELDISRTVGWITSNYPIQLKEYETIEQTIIQTKEMLRSIPDKGIGFGSLMQMNALQVVDGLTFSSLPAISFNYLGQLDNRSHEHSRLWQITDEDIGRVIAPENDEEFILNINSMVQNGILQFELACKLSKQLSAVFVAAFKESLLSVINHALSRCESGAIHTPSDYAVDNLSVECLRQLQRSYSIEAIYPATGLQQGFIYHHLSQPEDDAYRVQLLLDYHQPLDIGAYQKAWYLASLRYPALRTAFNWDGDIIQIITQGQSINEENFTLCDISTLDIAERDAAIINIQQQDRRNSFDLAQPGPIRFTLIKQSEQFYTVLKTEHHSIVDGWSEPILMGTVHQYYNALLQGKTPIVEPDTTYLESQDYYLSQKRANIDYWTTASSQWNNANDINRLTGRSNKFSQSDSMISSAKRQITIQNSAYQKIKKLCKRQGITLNVAVQFAWHKLLQTYTHDDQTIVGTTLSGRDIPVEGIESSVGMYINTLPLVVNWAESSSVAQILHQLQQTIAELNTFSSMPLSQLSSNARNLFHSLLVFENYPSPVSDDAQGVESGLTFRDSVEKTEYPLTVVIYEQGESLVISLKFDPSWMIPLQSERLLNQLRLILGDISDNPEQPHQSLSLLSEHERLTLLHTRNQTDVAFQKSGTLNKLFEQQVEKTPDTIALVYEGAQLTYQQLNAKANLLAHSIRSKYQQFNNEAIQPDTLIALYLDRSFDMIVSILAVLKAGAAYVPISPDYPQERMRFILEDARSVLVVAQQHYCEQLKQWANGLEEQVLILDVNDVELNTADCVDNFPSINVSNNLSYVIYTSGTTNQPKGVMIEHRSVINLVQVISRTHKLQQGVKALLFSNYVFDASVFELFPCLLTGCSLYIASEQDREDIQLLLDLINENRISKAFLPTALLHSACSEIASSALQVVHTGGDTLLKLPTLPAEMTFNQYGPTEATVCITQNLMQDPCDTSIGSPIDNTRLYVVDELGNLVPDGVAGELYVGGVGLARGYLNQPELTAEQFIGNPFAAEQEHANGYDRLYKSGDIVRWLPKGQLEYLGRNDRQVKIRGYRIELGEIENALVKLAEIKQAAVIEKKYKDDQYLAAYIVLKNDESIDTDYLCNMLMKTLPEYMIPGSFICLDALPLNLNGKLNVNALPEPVRHHQTDYTAPRTVLEAQICTLWEEVLGVEHVGINDNFFRLGGTSINAIKVSMIGRSKYGLNIPLSCLFNHKTVARVAVNLNEQSLVFIPRAHMEQYPLSFAQERLLFIEQFERGTDVYHISQLVQLHEHTDLTALENALAYVINRHSVLRTVYPCNDKGESYAVALDDTVPMPFDRLNNTKHLLSQVNCRITQVFDLAREPAIRLHRYIVGEQQFLLIVWHHIAFDGWSTGIFISELSQAYQAYRQGNALTLPELDIQYADYAKWQRDNLQGETLKRLLAYWTEVLSGCETLALPVDRTRPDYIDYRGRDFSFELGQELSEQLRELAKGLEVTLYSVLLSGFYVILARLSGQSDIVIGTPSDNRINAQTQSLIGFFVNSLGLRTNVQPEQNIASLITQVHQMVLTAKHHQELPFEQIVDMLEVERDSSRHPLYQVMFGVQHFSGEQVDYEELPFITPEINSEGVFSSPAKFDLSLFLDDSQANISGTINYAVSLFKHNNIQKIVSIYLRVLQAFVTQQDQQVSLIDILSKQERNRLLFGKNRDFLQYPHDKTVHKWFEEQVEKYSDSVALVYQEQTLSYKELNCKANQLARVIRQYYRQHCDQALKPGTLIALYLDKSLDMVISIFAVLKAGGAYVPISPAYPQDRVEFILQDSCAQLLVTHQHYQEQLTTELRVLSRPPLLLAADNSDLTAIFDVHNLESTSAADDLSYVIYTSGTTGQPKGVMISHRNVNHLVSAQTECFVVQECKRALLFSAYVFDASISEIFVSLLTGLELHICSEQQRQDLYALGQIIKLNNIELATLPPLILAQMQASDLLSLKTLVTAGETPPIEVLQRFKHGCRVFNAYGPTEVTVCVTANRYQNGDLASNIGQAINNVTLYILDNAAQLVPDGAVGELYIGGAGIARGYWNRPDLTAERFIDNPFVTDQAKGNTRLYKSGDLVRWLPGNQLEYIGRNDQQVKIRGFRIEPGEIEKALIELPEINQAIVIKRKHKENHYLAAYLVSCEHASLDADFLQKILGRKLPEYMVPSSFTFINQIPVTINGKLDVGALPEPIFIDQDTYVAPRTIVETQLCTLWANALGLDRVGINDNFFRIGGNSIIATRLSAVGRKEYGLEIVLSDLFEHKTVAGLAEHVDQQAGVVIPQLQAEQYPLSFSQERLLFIERFEEGTDAYHIPQLLQLHEGIQLEALEKALALVIKRHSILRTVYRNNDNGENYCMVLDDTVPLSTDQFANEAQLLRQVNTVITQTFDLTCEPAIRLHRYIVEERQFLLIVWHHIAFDGWSVNIFLSELAQAYHAYSQGYSVKLPVLEIQYSDYAQWQRNHLQGDILDRLLDYWTKTLSGYETLMLPTDYVRPSQIDYRGRDDVFQLEKGLSVKLRELAKEQEVTLYSLLLSGFYITLAKLSGQRDIVIGTPLDNRHHAQTQSIIGFFVNTLALRANVQPDERVAVLIRQVHEVVLHAKIHQELPFEKIVEVLDVERDSSRHPIYQVLFGVQSFVDVQKIDSELPFASSSIAAEYDFSTPAKYDLSLFLDDGKRQIVGTINYALSLFEHEGVKRLISIYQCVLQAIVDDVSQVISQINILSEQERAMLLYCWNQTDMPYPKEKLLHQLFEEAVDKFPDDIALVYGNIQLSYRELNIKANQFAYVIRECYQEQYNKAITPDTLIAVYQYRSLDMVVSLLAALKAGAAYVPISPDFPALRTEFILNDIDASIVLTQQQHVQSLGELFSGLSRSPYCLAVDSLPLLGIQTTNPVAINKVTDLSYAIYTSGTTGQPKGVLIEHRSVVSLAQDNGFIDISESDTVLHLSNPSFDAAVFEIWSALSAGAKLVIASESKQNLSSDYMHSLLLDNNISVLWVTRTLFDHLYLQRPTMFRSLRYLLIGGEALTPDLIKELIAQKERPEYILNGYGPTESTVFSTVYQCETFTGSVPIGKPFNTRKTYILDEYGSPVPIGTPGELYIGGAGLARSYLNCPELTAERFVDNVFATQADLARGYTQLYKTGDVVRWLSDGNIEYLGRNDSQVKIRGFRIELGEIEGALTQLPEIKQAVVIVRPHQSTDLLVAYTVTHSGVPGDVALLREMLSKKLPEYMLPSYFVHIDNVPMTITGKLDTSALPVLDVSQNRVHYEVPQTTIEQQLAALWESLLGVTQVGRQDNFFHLGGQSLLAAKLITQIETQWGVKLSIKTLFHQPVLMQLSQAIMQAQIDDDNRNITAGWQMDQGNELDGVTDSDNPIAVDDEMFI